MKEHDLEYKPWLMNAIHTMNSRKPCESHDSLARILSRDSFAGFQMEALVIETVLKRFCIRIR